MNYSISIITATYNAESCLENLINSILPQKEKYVEFIIIDGNSDDKTFEIIKKYEQYIDFWLREPDEGIYDAWNKGIKIANGEWIMFLGADDYLSSDAIQIYLSFINENADNKTLDLISSKRIMKDISGKIIRTVGNKWIWPTCLKGMMISHPGALHNKRLFSNYGYYNISYKIAGDYELLLRPKASIKTEFIDKITVIVSEGGVSDSFLGIKEHYKAASQHSPNRKFVLLINDSIVTIKYIVKKAFRMVGLNIHLN